MQKVGIKKINTIPFHPQLAPTAHPLTRSQLDVDAYTRTHTDLYTDTYTLVHALMHSLIQTDICLCNHSLVLMYNDVDTQIQWQVAETDSLAEPGSSSALAQRLQDQVLGRASNILSILTVQQDGIAIG